MNNRAVIEHIAAISNLTAEIEARVRCLDAEMAGAAPLGPYVAAAYRARLLASFARTLDEALAKLLGAGTSSCSRGGNGQVLTEAPQGGSPARSCVSDAHHPGEEPQAANMLPDLVWPG